MTSNRPERPTYPPYFAVLTVNLTMPIEGLTRTHADCQILASLPGAGPVHASRVISALGTDRRRYACVEA
jgi:hypothetical protein